VLVFVGSIRETDPVWDEARNPQMVFAVGEQRILVRVEEPFKGAKTGEEVRLVQPLNSSCSGPLVASRRYLFYVTSPRPGVLTAAAACWRTRPVSDGVDDLRFLRALPLSAKRSRLSGVLRVYDDSHDEHVGVVSGVRVRIKGPSETTVAQTDGDGLYEVYGLAEGEYTVEPELPRGMRVRFPMYTGARFGDKAILSAANRAASVDFAIYADNRISGRVLDPNGRPMKGVCVSIENTAGERVNRSIYSHSKDDGSYKLEMLPPGIYRVIANCAGVVSANAPFPKLYAPGTAEKDKGKIFTVGSADVFQGVDFRVPELAPRARISGRVQYSDGTPVAGVAVEFKPLGAEAVYARADEAGVFSFDVLSGKPGELSASLIIPLAMTKKCPELIPGKALSVQSEKMSIAPDRDITGLTIVFPFAGCPDVKFP
jgi:protocatechuate 3,4-dioxygenase beta subunit